MLKVKFYTKVSDIYKHDVLTKLKMFHTCIAPEMFDLMKIVIPEIMNEWEYIAYALRYTIIIIIIITSLRTT